MRQKHQPEERTEIVKKRHSPIPDDFLSLFLSLSPILSLSKALFCAHPTVQHQYSGEAEFDQLP